MVNRTNRTVSKHTRRRTLEDTLGSGRLNVENMDPNYHYRVENDERGKIQKLKSIGYEICTSDMESTMGDANPEEVGSIIQTTVNKEGTKGILMRQPIEFKIEDDAFKQKQIDETEKAMFRQAENEEGRYGDIKVE